MCTCRLRPHLEDASAVKEAGPTPRSHRVDIQLGCLDRHSCNTKLFDDECTAELPGVPLPGLTPGARMRCRDCRSRKKLGSLSHPAAVPALSSRYSHTREWMSSCAVRIAIHARSHVSSHGQGRCGHKTVVHAYANILIPFG